VRSIAFSLHLAQVSTLERGIRSVSISEVFLSTDSVTGDAAFRLLANKASVSAIFIRRSGNKQLLTE
jgi:hypothetical protein